METKIFFLLTLTANLWTMGCQSDRANHTAQNKPHVIGKWEYVASSIEGVELAAQKSDVKIIMELTPDGKQRNISIAPDGKEFVSETTYQLNGDTLLVKPTGSPNTPSFSKLIIVQHDDALLELIGSSSQARVSLTYRRIN